MLDPTRLDRMTDALAHRGPDGRGVWIDSRQQIGLGHRRLSILDLSVAGSQPMHSACGQFTVVFNGEIYNHVELRTELADYPFRGHSDTEVILAAYRRWGVDCISRFNGMFAFALWDAGRRELVCVRDRLGVKPLFYARLGREWLFGSEVKALLAAGYPAAPDREVWSRYLTYGSFERPRESFFAGVSSVPPGHYAVVSPDGGFRLQQWWYLPERVTEPWVGTEREAAEKLDGLLDEAVKLRMRSDVPVSLNLTGGLDSSAVTQSFLRQANPDQSIHVFTAAFDDPRYDEDRYADLVVTGRRCHRHVVRLNPEEVPALAMSAMWSQEAPFGGVGTLAYETVHKDMASRGLKVALEGQGGDELFGGYAYFQPLVLLDLVEAGDWRGALRFARSQQNRRNVLSLARRTRDGSAVLYQDGSDFLAEQCIAPEIRQYAKPVEAPAPFKGRFANALYRDLTETKLSRVLRMNDRLSMAHGVELRQPFLDYRLVEFAARLPADFKLQDGWGKHVLRRAMERRLPEEIVWTSKRPVVTPQREWMTGPLREWVGDIVSQPDFSAMGMFDVRAVRATFDNYLGGRLNNAFPVWQWINSYLWYSTFSGLATQSVKTL